MVYVGILAVFAIGMGLLDNCSMLEIFPTNPSLIFAPKISFYL
jgi:hypothetical protein